MERTDAGEFEEFILKRSCVKCHHQWFPRSRDPQRCPRCQTWLEKLNEDISVGMKDGDKNE